MSAQPDRRRRLLLLGGAALAAVVAVVAAIAISQGGSEDEGPDPASGAGEARNGQAVEAEVEQLFAGIPQDGTLLGEPDAPATLTEFADLQCPFCAQFAVETLPGVIEEFVRPGRLRLDLRLVAFIGPDSERGAEVAAAATLQDRVWPFSELFFRNQGPENSGYATDGFLRRLARATPGLDMQQLSADLDSPAAERLIRQAETLATRLEVEGTPSFHLARGDGPSRPLELQSLDPSTFNAQLQEALGEG